MLVAIFVVAILASIIFPVFGRAKKGANATVDVSNLRQFGISRSLYISSYDEVECYSHNVLSAYSHLDQSLSISKNDPTDVGYGNLYRQYTAVKKKPMVPYKDSYFDLEDHKWKAFDIERILPGNRAWLISPSLADIEMAQFGPTKVVMFCGRMQRLHIDGSISTRYVGDKCGKEKANVILEDIFRE